MRNDVVSFVRARFRAVGSKERAVQEKAYMKSALSFHGVPASEWRSAAKGWCAHHPGYTHDDLCRWVDALFATEFHDLRSTGIALLERNTKLLSPTDFPWLLEMVRASANWAHVDFLVTKVIGPILEKNPKSLPKTNAWAKDKSFWVRRAALLADLRPLRTGQGDFARFERIAVPMLEEREFFIRKAIGWVLREVSKKRPELVREFLKKHGDRASGLTRREASKYLP